MNDHAGGRVAVMGGIRTPFAKAGTAFRHHSALDLVVHSVNGLLEKQGLNSNRAYRPVCPLVRCPFSSCAITGHPRLKGGFCRVP